MSVDHSQVNMGFCTWHHCITTALNTTFQNNKNEKLSKNDISRDLNSGWVLEGYHISNQPGGSKSTTRVLSRFQSRMESNNRNYGFPVSGKYRSNLCTVYPKKYAHGFVVLCFVVVMQSFIMNSHEVFIHIHQGCFAGTGAIVRLPQCQWSKPDRYGKISQCITTTKHSKAKTVCIFLGIYCMYCILYKMFTQSCRGLGIRVTLNKCHGVSNHR